LLNARLSGQFYVATGDATDAYRVCNGTAGNPTCSALPYLQPVTKAIRSVASLRYPTKKAIFVYDRIESATPRSWEWNLHSFKSFEVVNTGQPYTIKAYGPSGGPSVCVDLYGPPVEFVQSDIFPIAPAIPATGPNPYPNQWHGTFRTTSLATSATFLAVLRENCAPRDFVVELDKPTGSARAVVNPKSPFASRRWVTFSGSRVSTYGGLN
jgi:hypothetical protein